MCALYLLCAEYRSLDDNIERSRAFLTELSDLSALDSMREGDWDVEKTFVYSSRVQNPN